MLFSLVQNRLRKWMFKKDIAHPSNFDWVIFRCGEHWTTVSSYRSLKGRIFDSDLDSWCNDNEIIKLYGTRRRLCSVWWEGGSLWVERPGLQTINTGSSPSTPSQRLLQSSCGYYSLLRQITRVFNKTHFKMFVYN